MTIQLRTLNFNFPNATGRVQTQRLPVAFSGAVRNAAAVLQGFNVQYNNGDHELLQETIQLFVTDFNNNTFVVEARLLLRDGSGNIDDPYSGTINAVVIADVVP